MTGRVQSPHTNPKAPGSAGWTNSCASRVPATFITTTTYGSWLPGDARKFVRDGKTLPSRPKLEMHARSLLKSAPVVFTPAQIIVLDHAIRCAADEFDYVLTDLSIEPTHLHWVIERGFDPVKTMVGRLKTRMRQAIGRGRLWTNGYCHRSLFSAAEIDGVRRYIARHDGCRMIDGQSRV